MGTDMKITIAEPNLNNETTGFTATVANETRAALAELFSMEQATLANPKVAPSKEELKGIKEHVYQRCADSVQVVEGDGEFNMLRVLSAAATVVGDKLQGVRNSYVLEYAFQWAKGYLFQNGLPLPQEYPVTAVGALRYPARTSCGLDYVVGSLAGVQATHLIGKLQENIPYELARLLPCVSRHERQYQATYTSVNGCSYNMEVTLNSIGIIGTVYTVDNTAWFAGFSNMDDFLKLRFRRMRLAALVKELTNDDEKARRAADIREIDGFDIVLHPNDRPFGAEYYRMSQDGTDLHSCMANSAASYDAPFDVHPCDVYSVAHYGQGDNGLVLVEAQQADVPVGRGILNVHTRQIVRWYGEYKASVMLTNTFGIDVDTDALDDVQLALIQSDSKIAAPYLDGCDTVDIEGGELFIRSNGDITMSDTNGYVWACAREYDVCSERFFPEDELVYQPFHETYYHPDCTYGVDLCPITGEYCSVHNTSWATVDGEEVRISDVVYYNTSTAPEGWVYLNATIGWTNNVDQYHYDEESQEYYTYDDYVALLEEHAENEVDDEAA